MDPSAPQSVQEIGLRRHAGFGAVFYEPLPQPLRDHMTRNMEPSAPQSAQEIGLRRRAGFKFCRRCVYIRPVNQQTRTVVPTRGLKWTLNSPLRLLVPRE